MRRPRRPQPRGRTSASSTSASPLCLPAAPTFSAQRGNGSAINRCRDQRYKKVMLAISTTNISVNKTPKKCAKGSRFIAEAYTDLRRMQIRSGTSLPVIAAVRFGRQPYGELRCCGGAPLRLSGVTAFHGALGHQTFRRGVAARDRVSGPH
jgi:hypothetical protein